MAITGLDALVIDGVDMRTYAYNVSTKTGRYSMPLARGEDAIFAGQIGYTFAPNKPYEAGEGTLSVWCNGRDPTTGNVASTMAGRRAQFETNMAVLQRFFTRRHRLSLIEATRPDGTTVRRAYVQWDGWDEPKVEAGGTFAEWSIHYTIPATFWEDSSGVTTQATTEGSGLAQTLNLSNFANMTGVIEDATLTVDGAITNPRITDQESGSWVQYTGTVPDGQSWVVDCGAFTSTVNSQTVMTATTHVGGYRLFVVPNVYNNTGTPQLTLSGSSGGAHTQLTVSARRKWVTA